MLRGLDQNGGGGRQAAAASWIETIDASVDWAQLKDLVGWARHIPGVVPLRHSPMVLLKAFLIQQWFGFTPFEIDHELEDRRSFRRFMGLRRDEPAPDHEELGSFRRALEVSGVIEELFANLRRQLSSVGSKAQAAGWSGVGGKTSHYTLATDVRMFRPPGWVSIEKGFLDYWHKARRGCKIPVLTQMVVNRAPEDIRPFLFTTKVEDGGSVFRYDEVGAEVERGNQGRLRGGDVARKAAANHAEYGHEGIQAEFLSTFRQAIARSAPVGFSSYYLNAAGMRCQIWFLAAPFEARDGAEASILGAMMVSPIEPLFADFTSNKQLLSKPDLAALSKFARPPGPPEWTALEDLLLDYWNRQRAGRRAPHMRDIKIADLPGLKPNLTLVRVLQPENDFRSNVEFRYEFVGDSIEMGNEGRIEGTVVGERIVRNLAEYGHAGLQGDLAETYRFAVQEIAPTATSRHFVNAQGHVRQIWSLQAPISNDDGIVEMLMGVMLVRPLFAN